MQTSMSVSGPAVVLDAVLGLVGLPLAAAVGDVRLVVDQRLGAQKVGNAGRHVADLGAGGLGVPAGEQGVVAVVRAFLDLQAFADFAGQALVLAEAQQPVERNLVLGGDVEQRFGAGQAGRGAGQQLRQRRAVDADRSGESRLVQIRALQKNFQAVAEQIRKIAFVHFHASGAEINFPLRQHFPAFERTINPEVVYNISHLQI